MARLNEIEFYYRVNHADLEFLKSIAQSIEGLCLVATNPELTRIDLISTIGALYYKDPTKCLVNSFLPSNHVDRFGFNVHYSCPFSEYSEYKLPYSIMADTFGYNNVFTRDDARSRIKEVSDKLNIYLDAKYLVYRIFQNFVTKLKPIGRFGESLDRRNKVVLYEVERWEEGKPIFK
jgi:hypothetical protein